MTDNKTRAAIAREWWYAYYRTVRIARRRASEAAADLIAHGRCVVWLE